VEQFRRRRVVPEAPPNYEFGEATLYETHRGALRRLRGLFKPLLKLFFNPDKITTALHIQSQVNTQAERRLRFLEEREPLYYELIHNLVLEVTRLGIEVHNLKMRVESLSSRLDFDERRARALEGVVQYRPSVLAATSGTPASPGAASSSQPMTQPPGPRSSGQPAAAADAAGIAERRARRRRRRGRRRHGSGASGAAGASGASGGGASGADDSSADPDVPEALDARVPDAPAPSAPAPDADNAPGASGAPDREQPDE
jgi:hypothetical protein